MYRKSLWDEIGMKPDTWDNVRIGGAKLKAKGHPVGISLGHSNDPNTTWRGLLWSYGGCRSGRDRQESRAQQQGDARSRQVRRRPLQGGDDIGGAVVERCQQQPVHRLGRRLVDRQPDLGLSNGAEAQPEAGRRDLRH